MAEAMSEIAADSLKRCCGGEGGQIQWPLAGYVSAQPEGEQRRREEPLVEKKKEGKDLERKRGRRKEKKGEKKEERRRGQRGDSSGIFIIVESVPLSVVLVKTST